MSTKARAVVLLPDALVDAVAERVVAMLDERQPSRWLNAVQAAEHLGCSKHRIYTLVSTRRIPHEHEGGRLLFDRAELDAWVRAGGAS
jgi:excisionase family DNA binding protein